MHSCLKTTFITLILFPGVFSSTSARSQENSEESEDDAFLNPSAEAETPTEAPAAQEPTSEQAPTIEHNMIRNHHLQGVFNVLIGTGFFMVAPYDKNDPDKMCQVTEDNPNEGEPFCTGRSGFHLDFTGGFGILPGFELYAIFRLGIEQPGGELTNQPKTRQLGAGLRVYSPKEGLFKIGFGVAPLFDFSDHGDNASIGKDFVIHVPIQAHFDINRWFGTYIQVAPNFSFISEFRLDLTAGIGVQGRFI